METGQVRAEKNWNLCALCEKETEEKLVCPNSTRKNYGSGYKSLADNLNQFREIGEVPIEVPLSSLDEGNGIEQTLKDHEAKWHKSCSNKCSTLKLQRAQKRKLEESSVESSDVTAESQQTCFFCNETGDNLRRAATLSLDSNVRAAATKLQDRRLLTKLAAGDLLAIDAYYHAGCLAGLYNRLRSISPKEEADNTPQVSLDAIALAELVSYIKENANQQFLSCPICQSFTPPDLSNLELMLPSG